MNTIAIKLDVTKVDKAKLYKGKSGTYLDVLLIATPDSKYGHDYMAVQGVSKEEREAGIKGAILGNAKVLHRKGEAPKPQQAQPTHQDGGDDVPF